jgi:hypothetical protein
VVPIFSKRPHVQRVPRFAGVQARGEPLNGESAFLNFVIEDSHTLPSVG